MSCDIYTLGPFEVLLKKDLIKWNPWRAFSKMSVRKWFRWQLHTQKQNKIFSCREYLTWCGCVVLKLYELWLTFANGNCQGLKMYKSKIVHTSWWLQAGVPGELLQLDLSGILTWCQVSQNPLLPILFHLYPRKYWIFASPLQFLLALWQPEKTRVNIW